jgi:hypothetical protein
LGTVDRNSAFGCDRFCDDYQVDISGEKGGKRGKANLKQQIAFGLRASALYGRRANSQAPCGRASLSASRVRL